MRKLRVSKSTLVPFLTIGFIVTVVAAFFMLLWNAFLSPTFGVTTLSYGQSVLGLLFIFIIVVGLAGLRQAADFLALKVSLWIAQREVQKQQKGGAELLKHFKMFGGNEEQN